jgi:predicted SprT family Zn-dependent metalloprotease
MSAFRFTSEPSFPFDAVTVFNPGLVVAGVRVTDWSASITVNPTVMYNWGLTTLTHTVIHELGHVLFGLGYRGNGFREEERKMAAWRISGTITTRSGGYVLEC